MPAWDQSLTRTMPGCTQCCCPAAWHVCRTRDPITLYPSELHLTVESDAPHVDGLELTLVRSEIVPGTYRWDGQLDFYDVTNPLGANPPIPPCFGLELIDATTDLRLVDTITGQASISLAPGQERCWTFFADVLFHRRAYLDGSLIAACQIGQSHGSLLQPSSCDPFVGQFGPSIGSYPPLNQFCACTWLNDLIFWGATPYPTFSGNHTFHFSE